MYILQTTNRFLYSCSTFPLAYNLNSPTISKSFLLPVSSLCLRLPFPWPFNLPTSSVIRQTPSSFSKLTSKPVVFKCRRCALPVCCLSVVLKIDFPGSFKPSSPLSLWFLLYSPIYKKLVFFLQEQITRYKCRKHS